ncbi:MAG: hypothetical protein JNK47_16355 [Mesorhizobium sp.]|nr:hypothetical protein [Mesorhizobium sp.]MBL8578795.1 hypothetical protein [Mesorhizobium sp.]
MDDPIVRIKAVLWMFISAGEDNFDSDEACSAWNSLSYLVMAEMDKISEIRRTAGDALHPLVCGPKEVAA